MSAIFGKCNADKKPVNDDELSKMQTALNHWQADAVHLWRAGPVGMGQLMLYNTPESHEEVLPWHDSNARLTITADARIDNRKELMQQLGIAATADNAMPDSQLILAAYRKYGTECTNHLVGDFAFAIWDEGNGRLFCARDHMGVKPFFYYARNGFFAFASEKKGLLCLPEVDQKVSRQYFYNHVFPSHIQAAGTTLYEHIHRLAPAHSLSYYPQKNNFQLHNYWTLDVYTELKLARKEDYYDGLRQHFEEAVRCRVRSNYDVGAELSGGMDSSSITGVAANLMAGGSRNLTTFTNADSAESLSITAERGLSEQQYVNDVVQFNKISDAVLVSENISDDPIVIADLLLQINDGLERWNLSWQIPIKQKAGSRNIRTILSGFPGDEMVTYRGEHFFLDYLDQKKYSAYFRAASKYPFKKVKPFLPPGLEFLVHKALNIAAFTGRPIKGATDFVPIPLKYRLTMGDVAWQDPSYRERYKSFRHFQRYRLLKPQVPLRMETETHLGTWYRLEPRFPMADIRLTQFYLSMPNALKYEGATSRWTWRQAVKRYLPDSVANRDSKIGALVPYAISPQDQQRRVEAIRKLITTSDKIFKHAKIKHVIGLEGKNSSVKNIMLLRWLEKNFENL